MQKYLLASFFFHYSISFLLLIIEQVNPVYVFSCTSCRLTDCGNPRQVETHFLATIRACLHYYYCLFCYILSLLFYTLKCFSIVFVWACVHNFLKIYFFFFTIKIKSYKSLTEVKIRKKGNIFVTCCLSFHVEAYNYLQVGSC